MSVPRRSATGAFSFENGWIISGGTLNSLKNVDQTFEGEPFSQRYPNWFTPLPAGLQGHCLVPLDNANGDIFLTGGWGGSSRQRNTYIYNSKTATWDRKSSMPTARSGTHFSPPYSFTISVQGDHSGCAKPPVDIKSKVLF